MKRFRFACLMALLVAVAAVAGAAEISGTYVEARNAEIYASHCFANSEMGLRGDLAVMGWQVNEGSWNNVSLDGLGVVAIVKARSTLGDPFGNPYPTKAVLIFDERASAGQREALASFAKNMSGDLLDDVVRTDTAPIALDIHCDIHAKRATLTAGKLVHVETRAIVESDSLCHLDDLYYTPLARLSHAMPAFALENRFSGEGLGVVFSAPRRSSAYLGTFSLSDGEYTD
jgi:hypothetical protein